MAKSWQLYRHAEASGRHRLSAKESHPSAADSVTVVICAYTERRWQSLLRAVNSLRGQRRLPEQCVVVIDHNEQLLRRARLSLPDDIEVLANEGRQGLSGARNTGVRAARGDVVAFLDDDAEADPGWLEELLGQYDDPTVVGAGGRASAVWPGKRPRWFPTEFDWVVGCSYTGLPETVAPVRNLIGAAMSFRRYLFDEIGTFDTEMGRLGVLPLGCEETEFAIRVRLNVAGAEILHVPSAIVLHHVEPERVRIRYFLHRCYAEGLSKAAVAAQNWCWRSPGHRARLRDLNPFPGCPAGAPRRSSGRHGRIRAIRHDNRRPFCHDRRIRRRARRLPFNAAPH